MVITDYRVQSVLRTYTRQLQRSRLSDQLTDDEDRKVPAERVTISDEAKHRLVMERMTSQVLGNAYPK
jgi:hypothetical protein